ncbi:MAG: T9SS type A sorting domain-containing protein [Bacteroidia bacterium]|nr:T9SS type A sorting domain-containing protein [Bacteroidia bacterium]
MKRSLLILGIIFMMFPVLTNAQSKQHRCGAMEHLEMQMKADPGLKQRMEAIERHTDNFIRNNTAQSRAVISIPVVFHVVYNTTAENLADSFLVSQINILNEDFRKMNADTTVIPSVFKSLAADTEIEFVIAKRDPAGNPTTGITRTSTAVTSWTSDDQVKFNANGGKDAWPSDSYLNFWVCDLSGGLLGYAQFPGGDASTDGVVCNYLNVGKNAAGNPYGLGRTATHEVGHWLNLRHIWGDASCGNDLVDDTPTQEASNSGCPAFPSTSACAGNAPNGDMYVNYMDYCNDACLVMFTSGQKDRMNAVLAPGGARFSLTSSLGGIAPGPCTDPPTGGSAQASASSVCAGSQVSLSLTGATHGTGQTYQWQYSSDNSSWSNMTNDTGMTALATVTSDIYYRCELTCGVTTSHSASVQVTTEAYVINTFPYLEDFDNLPLDCGWIIENTNTDGSTWEVLSNATYANSGTNSMYYTYSTVNGADDWIFTPAVQVSPNNEYRMTLNQRVFNASYPEDMEIWIGTAPNSGSMTNMLYNGTNLTNATYQSRSSVYHQPSEYGQLYFGIKCKSAVNDAYLFVDDIQIQESVVCTPGSAFAMKNNASCYNSNTGSINVSLSGGMAPYSFVWSNGATTEDLSNIAAGIYTVTATDNVGCITVKSVGISQPAANIAHTSFTKVKCKGSSNATMRVLGSGGTSPYTYSWNTSPVQNTAEATNVPAGTYTATVTDNNGCTVTRQVVLTEPSAIMPFIVTNNPGPGDLNLLVSGGLAPYTFNWSNGATTEDLSGVSPGFYFVYIKDKNSCAKLKSVNLTAPNNRGVNQVPYANSDRIELIDASGDYLVFPNPVSDILHLIATEDVGEVRSYRILNLMGELIAEERISSAVNNAQINIAVEGLATGVYFIQIEGDKTATLKFQKL